MRVFLEFLYQVEAILEDLDLDNEPPRCFESAGKATGGTPYPCSGYKLRTLLIVLTLGPPLLALGWSQYSAWRDNRNVTRYGIRAQRQPNHWAIVGLAATVDSLGTPPMFQFTIRDVLWLTVVVGLTVGWAMASRRMASIG